MTTQDRLDSSVKFAQTRMSHDNLGQISFVYRKHHPAYKHHPYPRRGWTPAKLNSIGLAVP